MIHRDSSSFNVRKMIFLLIIAGVVCVIVSLQVSTISNPLTIVSSVSTLDGTNFVVRYRITNNSQVPIRYVYAPEGRSNLTWTSSRIFLEGYPAEDSLQPGQGTPYPFQVSLNQTNNWSAVRLLVRYDRDRGKVEKAVLWLKLKLIASQSVNVTSSFDHEEEFVVSGETEIPKISGK